MSSTFKQRKAVAVFNNEQLVLIGGVLREMIVDAGATEKEVFIIGITGVYRSGKSFFLNLLHIFLEYYSKVNFNVINM